MSTWDTTTGTWASDTGRWGYVIYPIWADATETWDTITSNWSTGTHIGDATMGSTLDATHSTSVAIPVTATTAQVFVSYTNTEDRVSQFSVILNNHQNLEAEVNIVAPLIANYDGSYTYNTTGNLTIPSSATLDNTNTITATKDLFIPGVATFNNDLGESNLGGFSFVANSDNLAGTYGIILNNNLVMPSSADLGLISSTVNNVNYTETAALTQPLSMTSASRFLWNKLDDESTSWSDVSDSSDTWTDVTTTTTNWFNNDNTE